MPQEQIPVLVDLDPDDLKLTLNSLVSTNEQQISEINANAEMADAAVRFAGMRKFNEVDALEAVGAEIVGKIDPNV